MQMDCAGGTSFALSYLIHTGLRQHSERRLCSNPPLHPALLIPPSPHPALLHAFPLFLPSYYLCSAGPRSPAPFNAKSQSAGLHKTLSDSNFGHFRLFVFSPLIQYKKSIEGVWLLRLGWWNEKGTERLFLTTELKEEMENESTFYSALPKIIC